MSENTLILTPLKNAAKHLDRYFENISNLEQDLSTISLGFLISDSVDGTHEKLQAKIADFGHHFRSVTVTQKDFNYSVPDALHRWSENVQPPRRTVLAKSRNHLLFAALRDEDWVLWLDVDVYSYPKDVITQMLATGKSILHPNCVKTLGGQSFDGNAWRESGSLFMHGMRDRDLVRLEGVGGTMLLIKADIHRDGLTFPSYPYGVRSPYARAQNEVAGSGGGEYETEGLAMMAKDMGHETWGMPNLEIVHYQE